MKSSQHQQLIGQLSGCVAELPPCLPDDVQVLGCVMSAPVFKLFVSRVRQSTKKRRKKLDITMEDGVNHRAKMLSGVLELIGCAPKRPIPKLGWMHLPEDVPCSPLFEVYKVTASDRRVGLRGHRGLRAVQDIPAGTCLGPYRCLALVPKAMERYCKTPPPHWKAKVQDGSSPKAIWKYLVDMYAVDIAVNVNGVEHGFGVSAFAYGNKTALVNDACVNPAGYPQPRHRLVVGDQNADLIPVYVCGFPFLFLFTVEDVKAGDELLYEYGIEYWDCIREMSKTLDETDRRIVNSFMLYDATEVPCMVETRKRKAQPRCVRERTKSRAAKRVCRRPSPQTDGPTCALERKLKEIQNFKIAANEEENVLLQEANLLHARFAQLAQRYAKLQELNLHIRAMEENCADGI
ncbi:unnamed protein product [Ostreobium quekettii]|uniref:SET domain-containing protein n=1 Tax=Ostreobium quekettii TaxID=121088 RepID=A0A8S1IZD0_9CHLO|nr:unnamed protein product [Ostreobium quekettii]|eukprot:evm.model.scf_1693.2 EVM.evm.TU.scf_1693.2   scf_1693:16332-18380(-)